MTDDDGNHYPLINTLNIHVQDDTSIAIIYKLLPVPLLNCDTTLDLWIWHEHTSGQWV